MSKAIQIYVGTDQADSCRAPEEALEYSILKHASVPVDIHWMRAGIAPWDWHLRTPGKARTHTTFTPFRFGIPEHRGFEGRAIYLDVDMVVLADIKELWEFPLAPGKPWRCGPMQRLHRTDGSSTMKHKTEVSVFDCSAFAGLKWWPRIDSLIKDPINATNMARMMKAKGVLDETLPIEWDHLDIYEPGVSKLVHWTCMPTQPWKPFPDRYDYKRAHAHPAAEQLWHDTYAEAQRTHA